MHLHIIKYYLHGMKLTVLSADVWQEHPDLPKSERKRVCRLMDCRKLSIEACMHAAQNERLPLRTVVQVGAPCQSLCHGMICV